MIKILDSFKSIFLFQEPNDNIEKFILKEYKETASNEDNQTKPQTMRKKPETTNKTKKPLSIEEQAKSRDAQSNGKPVNSGKVSPSLDDNLAFLKEKYSIPLSTDIMIREFDISLDKKSYKAFIIFIDGMTDKKIINQYILQPLMLSATSQKSENVQDIITYIERNLVTQNQLKKFDEFEKLFSEINFGSCVLFVEGASTALVFDVKSWEHRSVEKPNSEITIRGPQESFGETLRVNTALIRKNLKNENLIAETLVIGQRSKTPCSIMYIKDLANPNLVQEVRRRLSSLNIDYANDSGIIEQLIEDRTFLPYPQVISTERPDRVSSMLSNGLVAILVDCNPFALIVPATFFDLLHSPEDIYSRFIYGNLSRFIRYTGMIFALLLPGIYVAVTTYHQEMIPTDLLIAISSAREMVPFPTVIEILIMEIAFELIREAGIRMPGTIGPTLGIIGALILGQAAVAANIVSPILIIIVAVTGLGSLAIPNFSLGLAFRTSRFIYILLGAAAGLLGISLGLFVQGILLASTKSFGVPYLSPFSPKTSGTWNNSINLLPIWMQENRPDYINPLDTVKQSKISRGWINQKGKGDKQK